MSLYEDFQTQYKQARLARDQFQTKMLSMLISDLKYEKMNHQKELTDDEIISFIQKQIKTKKDNIENYRSSNRTELIEEEQREIDFFKVYLPKMLTDKEIHALIELAVRETGAAGMKDMGLVMKNLMPKVKGRADGKTVKNSVSEYLKGLSS